MSGVPLALTGVLLSLGLALRAAQLQLIRRDRFRHPFYWAAFQLQGEWR